MQIISILSHAGSAAGSLPPEKLKRINSSTDQMIRIFKNLQTVAQTSSDGKVSLQLEKCSLQELITEAVNFSSEQAKSKNIQMEFDHSGVKEVINVLVDRDVFIFQIVTNFITNSLKFSESGQKIRVTLKMLDHMNVEIKIRDWGKGIPLEKISSLFSWSKKTSTSGTLGEKGTGLGLPLAMTFLKSMHGDIRVESSLLPGSLGGTEILITLPTFESLQKTLAA